MDATANSISVATMLPTMALAENLSVSAGKDQLRVNKVATDFESVFMSLLLKEMRNTLDSEDGGLFGSEGSDTFGGMFDMFMGQHLAEAQPLGISDAIKTYLDNSFSNEQTPANPEDQMSGRQL